MADNIDLINNTKSGFWRLSGPFLVLSFFDAFYALIDMFWVSQMSHEAFFAISIALPFVTLIKNFGKSMGTGTLSVISREIGADDYESAHNTLWHGIIGSVVLSICIILAIPFIPNLLALMNVTQSVDLVKQYLIPIFLCSIMFILPNVFLYTLQAEGDSKVPTVLLILTNILNLILDPILIFVLNFGISGAAYASILSNALITVYLFYWFLKGKSQILLRVKYFKPGIVFDIILVAIPNIFKDMLMCIVSSFINAVLLDQLGQIGVELYSAVSKIKDMILAPEIAFGKSLMTISGQLVGACEWEKLDSISNYAYAISTVITLIMGIVFFFIRDYAFAAFSVTGAETYVFYIALVGIFILSAMQFSALVDRIMAGIGNSYDSLFITMGISIFKALLIYVLGPILTSGACVLVGILISESFGAMVYYITLNHRIKRMETTNQSG